MGWEYIAGIHPGHETSQKGKKNFQPLYLAEGECWRMSGDESWLGKNVQI